MTSAVNCAEGDRGSIPFVTHNSSALGDALRSVGPLNLTAFHFKRLAIPEQREHDLGVSQLEWRSWHTTAADLGSVVGIFGTDQEVATSCDQPFD